MPHSSLTEIRGGLSDVQDTEMFDFVIQNVPGGAFLNERDLAIACQQAIYPGRSNEIIEVPLHGTQIHFRGRAVTPHQLQITYVENHKMTVTNTFQRWFEFQGGIISGTSQGYKHQYAVDGPQLIKYDTVGKKADVVTFYGLQPEDMPDVSLDGSSSGAYMVSITFRYDFYRTRNVRLR